MDISAGPGIAVREFPMKSGFGYADYLLYLNKQAIGGIEANAEGTLTGVVAQSAKYVAGLPANVPAHRRPLPFLYESNGAVNFFTNGLDPKPRSRQVFSFHRPEILKRDKLSLNLFWIKDQSLTDTDSVPAPDVLTAEIADDLETALELFSNVADKLNKSQKEPRK